MRFHILMEWMTAKSPRSTSHHGCGSCRVEQQKFGSPWRIDGMEMDGNEDGNGTCVRADRSRRVRRGAATYPLYVAVNREVRVEARVHAALLGRFAKREVDGPLKEAPHVVGHVAKLDVSRRAAAAPAVVAPAKQLAGRDRTDADGDDVRVLLCLF